MSQALLIGGSLGLMLALLASVRFAARRVAIGAESQRKFVHLGLGLYCLSFPWVFSAPWQVALLCAMTLAILVALRLSSQPKDGLGQALFAVGRDSYGDLLFALAIGIVFFRAGAEPVLYVLPVAILTLSDAAAALVGSSYGRRRFCVEAGQKSWEGVALFFLTGWIIAMAALLLLSDVPRPNVILLGLFVAAFGALVEAGSWRGLDNLFVPVALQAILIDVIPTSGERLLELLLMLGGTMTVTLVVGRALRSDFHVAHAAGVILFMIWTIAGLEDVILPSAAFIAVIAAEKLRPSPVPYPHLNALFATVAIALFWLLLGEAAGFVAIHLYNLAFAGAGIAVLAIARPRRPLLIAGVVLVMFGLQQAQAWLLGPPGMPALAFAAISGAALAATALLAAATAHRLDSHRDPKAFGLGLCAGLSALPLALP
ncbi:MAG: diacylglycerol/polyprenol kinase family protein [Alphaproteobacteria bacterium]